MLVLKRFFPLDLAIFVINLEDSNTCVLYFVSPNLLFRISLPVSYSLRLELINEQVYGVLNSSKEIILKDALVVKTFCNALLNRIYFQNYVGLKTIGIGYKFVVSKTVRYIFISAGLTHLLAHRMHPSTQIYKLKKKKRLLVLTSSRRDLLLHECKFIRDLRPPDLYSGKGLRLFHEVYQLKEGKKQIR